MSAQSAKKSYRRLTPREVVEVEAAVTAGELTRSVAFRLRISHKTVLTIDNGPNTTDRGAYLPSPEEIAAKCAEFRRRSPRPPVYVSRWRAPVLNEREAFAS
jgi:hypothetical protein